MKKFHFLLFFYISGFSISYAQLISGEFAIGGTVGDIGWSVIQTTDKGYAIAATTESFGAGFDDAYVVRLDSIGNLRWTKTIGGTNYDEAWSIIQTKDKGFAITGYTESYGAGGADVYLIKLDSLGVLKWNKTYGGTNDDFGQCVIQTKDGGYAITGYTNSYGAGGYDVYVLKIDSSGNLQWSKTIGGVGADLGWSIIQSSDGGYAIAGYTASFGAGYNDVYVIKLDSSGNLKWTKTIGGSNKDMGYSIIQVQNGDYLITGTTDSYNSGVNTIDNIYVIKLDASGNLKWTETVGDKWAKMGYSIILTKDNGFVIGGYTADSISPGLNFYILKMDSVGKLKWTNSINGAINNLWYSIIQTKDGGYALAGETSSYGHGTSNIFLIKIDSTGNTCSPMVQVGTVTYVDSGNVSSGGIVSSGAIVSSGGLLRSGGIETIVCKNTTGTNNIMLDQTPIAIFPNPNNGQFNIALSGMKVQSLIEVYNVLGEQVYSQFTIFNSPTSINLSNQPSGIYFCRIITQDGSLIGEGKLIIQK